MEPYLTAAEIEERLSNRFEIEATVVPAVADMASDEVDALAPFIGTKLDETGAQERPFPRSINPDGTPNEDADVPWQVLDAVAVTAGEFALGNGGSPALTSESIGSTSRSYASPKRSEVSVFREILMDPFLLKIGQRL